MGCCDNKCCSADSTEYPTRKEREIPDGFEPCCSVPGQRCLCLPYGGDPWLISSQILTICATFFSWMCWVTLLVSCIGFILFQLLWCVRMRRSPLLWYIVVAGLISVMNLGIAIYVLVAWRKKEYCRIFDWYTENYYSNDDRYTWPNTDYCQEKTWFAIALACALLWAGVTFCITWFVKSGRHAKWEEEYTTKPSTEVEIITKPPPNEEEAERDTAVVDASGLETEKNERGRFVCVPYDDPWPIAAQILAVVSVGFSWVSRPAFAVNLIGIGLYQILWCIRMKTASLIGLMVVAGVISSMNLGIAIFVLVFFRNSRYCEPFDWYNGSSGWWTEDYCHQEIYFAVALVCALLWAAAMCCTICFVTSGRHAKWQELYAATEVKRGARGGDAMVASMSAMVFALPEFETFGPPTSNAYPGGDGEAVMAVPVENEEPVIVLDGTAAVSGVQVVAVVSGDAENEDSNSKQLPVKYKIEPGEWDS